MLGLDASSCVLWMVFDNNTMEGCGGVLSSERWEGLDMGVGCTMVVWAVYHDGEARMLYKLSHAVKPEQEGESSKLLPVKRSVAAARRH